MNAHECDGEEVYYTNGWNAIHVNCEPVKEKTKKNNKLKTE